MFHKIALNRPVSRKTADQLHRYLMDFGEGTHRLFWIEDRAFIEFDCDSDAELVRGQFPNLVGADMRAPRSGFPW